MPIYPFLCNECGHKFEIMTLSVKEAEKWDNRICPNCFAVDTRQLIGSFMWRFGSPAGDRNERRDK